MAALLLFGILSSVVATMPALAVGAVVDELVRHARGEHSELPRAVATFLALTLVADALKISFGATAMRFTNKILIDVRQALIDRWLNFSKDGGPTRESATFVIGQDVPQIVSLYGLPLTTVVSDLLESLAITVIVTTISWKLASILILPVVPIFLVAKRAGARQAIVAKATRADESSVNKFVDSLAADWTSVQVFKGAERERRDSLNQLEQLSAHYGAANRNLASMMVQVGVLRLLAVAATITLAAKLAQNGEIAVGAIATLVVYMVRFYSPAINLAKAYQQIQRAAISAHTIMDTIGPDGCRPQEASTPVRTEGPRLEAPATLCIREGFLTCPDGQMAPLQEMQMGPTGLVLVIGPSGSGKSTLLRSLMGLGPGRISGGVYVNGHRMESADGRRWLDHFTYASQQVSVATGSVLEAAMYPDRAGDETEVRRVMTILTRLKLDHLKDRALTSDVDSISGGEARRVAFARCIKSKAPIILADEPTSNLDDETRVIIEQCIIEQAQSRVVIATAHNPSACVLAAADLVIDLAPTADANVPSEAPPGSSRRGPTA